MNAAAAITRRQLLQLGASIVAVAALAACGSAPAGAPASTAASASGAAPSGGASALRKLVVASTSIAGTQTALWLAEELKSWSSRGLQVERQRVASDIGTKALLNKDIDVLIQSPNPILAADLNGGADLVYVASIFNFAQFGLAAKASIQSAADLKGKSVANDAPGSPTDFQTRKLLDKLGLQPSDVQLPIISSSDAVLAALLAGKVDSGVIAVPQLFQAEASGFHVLANTFDVKYQNIGPVVSRARIDELAPSLLVLLMGLRDGIRAFVAQPDLAKKLISQNTQESNPDVLQKTYDFYTKATHFQDDLEPTTEGLQSIIDFAAQTTLPAAKGAKPAQFVDRRILDRLPKS